MPRKTSPSLTGRGTESWVGSWVTVQLGSNVVP